MSESNQLTDLQVAIMRILWARGEASVAEVWEAIRADRPLALTTVATLLTRLEKRGIVSHTTRARQFLYRPEVDESEVRSSMVSELAERLFDGDVAELMSHLLSSREVSSGDLAKVRALVEARARDLEGHNGKR